MASIELNVHAIAPDGHVVPGAITTLYVLDKNLHECPMEPRIRDQGNFYAASVSFATATGSPGPFQVYASVLAPGYNPAYIPLTPWDGTQTLDLDVHLTSFKRPFQPAPRYWDGVNMCGVRLHYLPFIPGSARDASLFMSWFYPFYDADTRARVRGDVPGTHWLMSWPDARARGFSPTDFLASCAELAGRFVCAMLCSKDFDRDPGNLGYLSDENARRIIADVVAVLPAFKGRLPMFSLGWELADWWQPWQLQWLIDAAAAVLADAPAGTLTYVHLGQGKGSWQPDGHHFADFWNTNIGKLNGLLHERILNQSKDEYRFGSGGLYDILIRFAGGAGCSPDDGSGHPFDCVGLEITAQEQFDGSMTEAEGDTWAQWARDTPAVPGPFGPVGVMGSAN